MEADLVGELGEASGPRSYDIKLCTEDGLDDINLRSKIF